MNELEALIAPLVARRLSVDENSAEYAFITRQLRGLRYTREGAGGIIEDLDPVNGFDTATGPLPALSPQECQRSSQPGSKEGSLREPRPA
jgi:hypothetical protein